MNENADDHSARSGHAHCHKMGDNRKTLPPTWKFFELGRSVGFILSDGFSAAVGGGGSKRDP